MAVTGAISPKTYANAITRHEKKKKYFPMQHMSVINKNKHKTEKILSYPIFVHFVISIKENGSKQSSRSYGFTSM